MSPTFCRIIKVIRVNASTSGTILAALSIMARNFRKSSNEERAKLILEVRLRGKQKDATKKKFSRPIVPCWNLFTAKLSVNAQGLLKQVFVFIQCECKVKPSVLFKYFIEEMQSVNETCMRNVTVNHFGVSEVK